MNLAKPAIIGLCSLLLGACANMQQQDRLAQQRAAQQRWSEMMDQHHNSPAASGPRWQLPNRTAEAYLTRMEQFAQQDSAALLQAGTAVDCELDEASRTLLIHQVSPERLARDRAALPSNIRQQYLDDSVTVLSGSCEQGRLVGRFSAVFGERYNTRSQYYNSDTTIRGRIDGHFRNGQLDGEVRVLEQDTSTSAGRASITRYYRLGVYETGEKVGTHVTLALPESGGRVRYVTQVLAQGVQRTNTWMNGKPNTRFHMRDGEIEGWMEFASAVLRDDPQCYRAGQKLEDGAYCRSIQPQLEPLPLREAEPGHARLHQGGS